MANQIPVRFWGGRDSEIEYALPGVPARGDLVHFDGSDPEVKGGAYRVRDVDWQIGLRGLTCAEVQLDRSFAANTQSKEAEND